MLFIIRGTRDQLKRETLIILLIIGVSANMSFPPHLNQIAQLPPGISPSQFAGFPTTVPTGNVTPIIPVPVGMMPPSPAVLIQTAMPVVQKLTKDSFGTRNKDSEEGTGNNTGPTTTVFVGNISEKASDMLVRQMLARLVSLSDCFMSCKPKLSWIPGRPVRGDEMG
uniref:RNA-binding protein 25-like n=1 Tax=Sinocyclocheilus rhinocerous TaxID=307959 RepID=A0A673GZC8_9TELE